MARFLARLSKPMPLAMYYLITFVLSVVALILAVIIRLIVSAFSSGSCGRITRRWTEPRRRYGSLAAGPRACAAAVRRINPPLEPDPRRASGKQFGAAAARSASATARRGPLTGRAPRTQAALSP
jgi:hypothetical protein